MELLKYFFNKQNRLLSILSLIYLVFGILCCIIPIQLIEFLEPLICIILLAYSGIVIFASVFSSEVLKNKFLLITMIISLVFGVLILWVKSFFVLLLAFYLLYLAINKILILNKQQNKKNFLLVSQLILSIFEILVFIIVCIFLILNNFKNISIILIGIVFIFEFMLNLFILLYLQKYSRQLENLKQTELNEEEEDDVSLEDKIVNEDKKESND